MGRLSLQTKVMAPVALLIVVILAATTAISYFISRQAMLEACQDELAKVSESQAVSQMDNVVQATAAQSEESAAAAEQVKAQAHALSETAESIRLVVRGA